MGFLHLFPTLFLCASASSGWPTTYPYESQTKCEKITVPLCRTNESKYDQTRLPNFISFTNQARIKYFTQQTQLQELVKTRCSRDLVFFLCSVLTPICISDANAGDSGRADPMVPPCRSLCKRVYNDCIQSIQKLNFSWPGSLNCSGLPDHNEGVCITPAAFVSPLTGQCAIYLATYCLCRLFLQEISWRNVLVAFVWVVNIARTRREIACLQRGSNARALW